MVEAHSPQSRKQTSIQLESMIGRHGNRLMQGLSAVEVEVGSRGEGIMQVVLGRHTGRAASAG